MPSIVTEDPNSIPAPAIHICNNGEGVPPELATTLTADSRKPSDPTLHGKYGGLPVNASTEEDEARMISPSRALAIRSAVEFLFGNFFLATFFISLIIFIVSFIVTWFTVLRDARSMNSRALSDAAGVSVHHTVWILLMLVAAVGSDTRARPSAGPRCTHIIHFVEGRYLRGGHDF